MIKYILTVISFPHDGVEVIKKSVVEYSENELTKATQIIAGLTTECLVSKKTSLDSICLEKQKDNDVIVLYYAHFDEYSHRYVNWRL